MKLLLRKDIPKLGLAGDMVDVKPGFARNYLLPQHLALEPTKANLKKIEEDKRRAAEERARRHEMMRQEAARLAGKEITIKAAANEEGHLYGSVGPRDIARALVAEGFGIHVDQVRMDEPIKQLDARTVSIVFTDDIRAEVKVWVVPEKTAKDLGLEGGDVGLDDERRTESDSEPTEPDA
ncbi:MAG: 50S ribosomal protein L9 [Phycisphaerae bacterium]|nr:50S ribosomal protein L9 [Phycisphaerae bacterium]